MIRIRKPSEKAALPFVRAAGSGEDGEEPAPTIPAPDLLFLEPCLAVDRKRLGELLERAFLAGATGNRIDDVLGQPVLPRSAWNPDFFRDELFVDTLVAECFTLADHGQSAPVNRAFMAEVLSNPPASLEGVRFRQEILLELERDEEIREKVRALYDGLFELLCLFKAPHSGAKLDIALFRYDILRQAHAMVKAMAEGFGEARSGLGRLAEAAQEIQATDDHAVLTALLDYENHLARVDVRFRLGYDGRVREIEVLKVAENVKNRFYRGPLRRLYDRWQLFHRGYSLSDKEMGDQVLYEVFRRINGWVMMLLQVMVQLELYLAALALRERMASRGLAMSMPEVETRAALDLESLFNPLLFLQDTTPIPCRLSTPAAQSLTLITGPNSGGKTRLLQAVGISQLLGQSGLYVPAARARLPVVQGLFTSIIESGSVDQLEGRLGRELSRVRTLFESLAPNSMVILDELCSGTNPTEAVEILGMILELLQRLEPLAFVTTHFLEFARTLLADTPEEAVQFLQVVIDARQQPTYQFAPGVAHSSLAAATARRVGVTLEELSGLIAGRNGDGAGQEPLIHRPGIEGALSPRGVPPGPLPDDHARRGSR